MTNAEDLIRRGDGAFAEKYDESDVLAALAAAFPEPLSATEVGERTGMARTTAHNRLEGLVEDGPVATKKLGARSRAYFVSSAAAAEALRE